ncbi:MAG: isochorismatase family protein [Nanoarchaeota archaeon]|mgnify:CR=1 FL=1
MKIFYDVDTQNDFMNKNGVLYVPDAELIKHDLWRLTDYAKRHKIPIVGSVDQHFGTEEYKLRERELQQNGGPFPDHCLAGTDGQKKIELTQTAYSEMMGIPPTDEGIYIPHYLDGKVRTLNLIHAINRVVQPGLKINDQIGLYFEKQSYDVFTNPAIGAFLELAEVNEAVVYGVATDYCVKAAVLGMQKMGIQCYVVEDAIKGVTPETEKAALTEMLSSGAKLTTVETILKECLKQKEARK